MLKQKKNLESDINSSHKELVMWMLAVCMKHDISLRLFHDSHHLSSFDVFTS